MRMQTLLEAARADARAFLLLSEVHSGAISAC